MHKNLITIVGYTVQTHAIVSLVAVILAAGLAYGMTKHTQYYKHMNDFLLYALIAGVVGARIWHVFVFQWPFYAAHPLQIFAVWAGGISILGSIAFGVLALWIYSRVHQLKFFDFADYMAPPMMLGMGLGRFAALWAGDVFGTPTGGDFGIVFPKGTDAYHYFQSQPLWPAAMWETQGDFMIFSFLMILFFLAKKKLTNGWIFLIYVFLYSALRFSLGFIRGDSPRYWLGLNGGQWSTLAFMFIALIMMVYLLIRYGLTKQEKAQ